MTVVLPHCGVATGDGDKIMRYCPSFHIVQLMSQGLSPQQACETAVTRMKERHGEWFEVGVIALDNQVRICGWNVDSTVCGY